MKDYRFFERNCLLIGFKDFEQVMQELFDDRTIRCMQTQYPYLYCYSPGADVCYDEEEIVQRMETYLGKRITATFMILDAEEIYFVYEKEKRNDSGNDC